MHRSLGALILVGFYVAPLPSFCQAPEHPIIQPNSFGYGFEGPALSLGCVALLKADPQQFVERVRAKPPQARRDCVQDLLQSLTPEPEFTAEEFQRSIERDPHRNLLPADPELAKRMGYRLGVNISVSESLATLAQFGLIDEPAAIGPLIRCLKHPLLQVGRKCNETLVSLTRHRWGQEFYLSLSPTQEGRERVIDKWMAWSKKMQNGHLLFDEWLRTEVLAAVHELGGRLAPVLISARDRGGRVAASYVDFGLANARGLNGFDETVFYFGVGYGTSANWPGMTGIDSVGVRIFRLGLNQPAKPESAVTAPPSGLLAYGFSRIADSYYETFPALDLQIEVAIATTDGELRTAYYTAAKEALARLRRADQTASRH